MANIVICHIHMQCLVVTNTQNLFHKLFIGSADDPKDKNQFCAAARSMEWERLKQSSCQDASKLISHVLEYLEQEHESL